MSTYVPIQAITLSATASSVTFTGIPQTFTDLVIATSTASDLSSGSEHILCRFNSDSGSNYSATYMYGTGSSALSGRNSNTTGAFIGRHEQTELGTGITHIQNYSNTTTNKTVLSRGGLAGQITIAYVSTWRNTAAITSITLTPNGASNFDSGSTFTLYGIGSGSPKAFGGDVVATDGTYWYHAFTKTGRFEPTQTLNCDILVIAGGGGGGPNGGVAGGGGGAGGLLLHSNQSLSSQGFTVTVGAGGVGGTTANRTNGSNSQFGSLTASVGGGRAGGDPFEGVPAVNGSSGGSGGGGGSGYNSPTQTAGTGGAATSGQGFAGGNGIISASYQGTPGGGGGAGAVGVNATATVAGNGGAGVSTYSSWGAATSTGQNISGTRWFAGGGGGGCAVGQTVGQGGNGGGGKGGDSTSAVAGTANTGGGGGGGSGQSQPTSQGQSGGSGIVIVRYSAV